MQAQMEKLSLTEVKKVGTNDKIFGSYNAYLMGKSKSYLWIVVHEPSLRHIEWHKAIGAGRGIEDMIPYSLTVSKYNLEGSNEKKVISCSSWSDRHLLHNPQNKIEREIEDIIASNIEDIIRTKVKEERNPSTMLRANTNIL
jgi:hypothetical protein